MEAFLKVVFILVLVYYAFKLVGTYVLPWLLGRFVKKQQEKFFGQNQSSENSKGSDTMSDSTHKEKKPDHNDDKSFGEYVDFEDVKE